MKKLRIFFIGLLAFIATSAVGQDVRFNFDVAADFSKFKTYRWVPIEGATQAQGLTDEQVTAAFDAELRNKGLAKVASETADCSSGISSESKRSKALVATALVGDTEKVSNRHVARGRRN